MKRAAPWLLTVGVLLFIGMLMTQDMPGILQALRRIGWGILLVAAFHLLPLLFDALAIDVLFRDGRREGFLDALRARWVGESANSLMPAGQLGGPVLMARQLARRGMPGSEAAGAIIISTTLQTFGQIAFALTGIALLSAMPTHLPQYAVRSATIFACALLGVQVGGFYLLQRRGMFGRLIRWAQRFSGSRDWSNMMSQADAIDAVVRETYTRNEPIIASFVLSLIGWFLGAGEVWLITAMLGVPLGWHESLILESLGQAIRGAGFAIPGALGVQEGGYLLLAPLVGLPAHIGISLALAKRAREVLLGLPGLLYLRFAGRVPPRAATG